MTQTQNLPTFRERQNTLKRYLGASAGSIAQALPLTSKTTAERLVKIALTAATRNPELLNCTPESVALALMHSAETGLEPTGPLGLAALVPYRGQATFQLMFRGMIALALRTGRISFIQSAVVYEKDAFVYTLGLNPQLEHVPYAGIDEPGQVIFAYAVAHMKDGSKPFEVLRRSEIDQVMRQAASRGGPWKTHYVQMARKTAVKALFNRGSVPLSIEDEAIAEAIYRDGEAEVGLVSLNTDVELPEAPESSGNGSAPSPFQSVASRVSPPEPEPAAPRALPPGQTPEPEPEPPKPRKKRASRKKTAAKTKAPEAPPAEQAPPAAEPPKAPEPIDAVDRVLTAANSRGVHLAVVSDIVASLRLGGLNDLREASAEDVDRVISDLHRFADDDQPPPPPTDADAPPEGSLL